MWSKALFSKRMARRMAAVVAAVAAFCACATAQRTYTPEFYIGGKAGATLSRTSFTPSVKQGWLTGATAGIAARYTEERIFGLVAELNIRQCGWKESFDDKEDPIAASLFAYNRRLTYIQLPVMTHIYFGRRVKGFFNLGPSVGYMIGESVSSNFDYRNPQQVENFPHRNRTTEQMAMDIANRFDYGIVGGAGVEFAVRRRHSLLLEGRYYFGIGNIFKSAKKDFFSASRGMSIEITLSYLFKVI